MGTNTHRLQCVSMEGGSSRGGGPRVGSWSSELPCALSGACDGNSGCEWPQPAGLQSSACCLMLGLTSSDFRAGCILSDGLNGRMAGGRERSLSEMWSLLGCLSRGQGRHHGVPGEQHPQHPALSSGTTGTLSQGVWERWCWHPGPRASSWAGSAQPHCRAGAQLSAARSCLQ